MEIRTRHLRGFTLTELLVVIGVIALLIGMLLPTLGRTREVSRAAVCGQNLRQMMTGWESVMAERDQIIPNIFRAIDPTANEIRWHTALAQVMSQDRPNALLPIAGRAWLECPTRAGEAEISYQHWQFGYAANVRWRPNSPDYDPAAGRHLAANEGQRWDLIRNPAVYPWFAEPFLRPRTGRPFAASYFGLDPNRERDWDVSYPHDENMNLAFADGHVERLPQDRLTTETDDLGVPLWLYDR